MRILVLICTMLPGVASAQTPTTQVWINGDVTVTTSESLTVTAVRVKGHMLRDSVRSGKHHVLFCVTHATPIASKLNYTGPGRVVYRTARSGRSTTQEPRAETMLPALAVLQANGESPFFLAQGTPYPHPPNERSLGKLSTFAITQIVRHDVRDQTKTSSCVEGKRDDHPLAGQTTRSGAAR